MGEGTIELINIERMGQLENNKTNSTVIIVR